MIHDPLVDEVQAGPPIVIEEEDLRWGVRQLRDTLAEIRGV